MNWMWDTDDFDQDMMMTWAGTAKHNAIDFQLLLLFPPRNIMNLKIY
jgi:hypothetical protein